MTPSQLSLAAAEYLTDKFTPHRHCYERFYDVEFPLRRKTTTKILEIGVGFGGSIKLWHDYFLLATIHGVDEERNWVGLLREDYPRVRLHQAPGYDPDTYKKLPDKFFDIIIDDGSHALPDQQWVLSSFPKWVKSGGIIIVEDVTSSQADHLVRIPDVEIIDWLDNPNGLNDDRLAIRRIE
jgi:trans-aconitate methyltransferase